MNEENDTEETMPVPEQSVVVVTDSVAQVPTEIARQLGITVLPFTVNIDGQPYRDGIDLKPTELYRRMRLENNLPTTTAASLGQYQQAFETCLNSGAQAVLCVALSNKLSSGYNTATQAAAMIREDFPDRRDCGTGQSASNHFTGFRGDCCCTRSSIRKKLAGGAPGS